MAELQLVVGGSGSGKSTWLYDYVNRKAEKEPWRSFLVLVPEQFTLHTQKALVSMQKNKAIMNIDVLSFQRLAYRVFDDLGMRTLDVLGENGKNLCIRRVAQEKETELTVLSGHLKHMGFVSEMKSLISEFMQYRVKPETLRTLAGEEKDYFSEKLKDIATIYEAFLEFIHERYVTAEEILELLIAVADRSELIRDSVVILDGFTGFTPVQLALLRQIFPMVAEVKAAADADTLSDVMKAPEVDALFYMSARMCTQLTQIAQETGGELLDPVILKAQPRFAAQSELAFLERHLFREDGAAFDGAAEHIHSVVLRTPRDELQYTAAKIRQLVRTAGYRYKEIAVVSAAPEVYAADAEEVFSEYGIPIFLDQNLTLGFHPVTELFRGCFAILKEQYSVEAVFHFLRSGLTGIDREEIDALETWCLSKGIRGAKWKKPFAEDGAFAEPIRLRLVELIEPVRAAFQGKNHTAAGVCRALYGLLEELQVAEKTRALQKLQEERKELRLARYSEKIYEIVIELLDKIAELIGEEALSVTEFEEVFQAGLEAEQVGLLPAGYDRVVIGDIERSRFGELKVLFFLGVNDKTVPRITENAGLISEPERARFEAQEITLSPNTKERAFIQRFYLYMNLTKPSEQLYLLRSCADAEGMSLRPSYLFAEVKKCFPDWKQEMPEEDTYLLESPESAEAALTEKLRNAALGRTVEDLPALLGWFLKNTDRSKIDKILNAALKSCAPEKLDAKLAERLYGHLLDISATRLEQFASCPYRQFLRYGLRLQERLMHEFQAPDLGVVLHGALERIGQQAPDAWQFSSEAAARSLVGETLDQSLKELLKEDFFSDPKGVYDRERLQRVLLRTVSAIGEQFSAGEFRPFAYELPFTFATGDEKHPLQVRGRIDRLDLFTTAEEVFFRIMDYKTGNTEFRPDELYHGIALQLPLYLSAAFRVLSQRAEFSGKRIKPAGMLLYHVDDPTVQATGEESEEELHRLLLRSLRPTGMVSMEPDALAGMDAALSQAGSTSDVIPARLKNDGTPYMDSGVVPEESLLTMSYFTDRKCRELSERILAGEITPSPAGIRKKEACTYCTYRGICGFDERLQGYRKRQLPEIGRDEAVQKMAEELTGAEAQDE